MEILLSLIIVKILFIINIMLCLVNSEITNIYLNNSNILYKFNNNQKFKAISEEERNLPNYLKIQVDFLYNNDNNDNQFVISYYQQNASFKERKQFSQSFINSTFIWLNKKQINKNFYFSVDSSNISLFSYNLTIYKIEYAELNFGDIYNYYVTEENKDMLFLIKFDSSKYFVNKSYSYSDYKLIFWARSGKSLHSALIPVQSIV